MSLNFSFLDFFWKLLIIVALSSSIIFGTFLSVRFFSGKITGRFYNRICQWSLVSVGAAVVLGTFLLSTVDQDLQERCYGSFARLHGAFGVTRWLAVIWIFGILVLLSKDIFGYRRFSSDLQKNILEKRADYLVSSNEYTPLTFGLLRGKIVIPLWLANQKDSLIHILAHEAVHLRNRDILWNLLSLCILRLAWFNPLVFIFDRRRLLALEMATDEEAIEKNQFNPSDYAKTLLQVMQVYPTSPSSLALGATAGFSHMKARLENLSFRSRQRSPFRYRLFVLLMMSGGWIFGLTEALASIKMRPASAANERMCYQVQHEKIIENWLSLRSETNKCE